MREKILNDFLAEELVPMVSEKEQVKQYLIIHFHNTSNKALSEALNLPVSTIRGMGERLGLRKDKALLNDLRKATAKGGRNPIYRWTAEQDRFIMDNYLTLTQKEMAEHFNVKPGIIEKRYAKLSISRGKILKWTDEKNEWLKTLWQSLTPEQIASKIGCCEKSLVDRCYKLGLHKKENPALIQLKKERAKELERQRKLKYSGKQKQTPSYLAYKEAKKAAAAKRKTDRERRKVKRAKDLEKKRIDLAEQKRLEKIRKEAERKQAREEKLWQAKPKKVEKGFKTKVVDYSQMIQVRIDPKTIIYVKPGTDIEKVKKQYSKAA